MARTSRTNSTQTPLINPLLDEEWPHGIVASGNGRIGGSSASDILSGGSGADILIGHGASDILNGNEGSDVLMGERTVPRNPLLATVTDFAIIYQGPSYTQPGLRDSDHDLIIINPARTIDFATHVETLWTAAEIADIKTPKLVVAYLDLTKVNDYESSVWSTSWTSNGRATGANTAAAPSWLGGIDPDDSTQSTRLINLEDPGWVAGLRPLLFARIDQIVARGYNGLFLDDLGRFFVQGNNASTANNAREIRDLVINLAEYARAAVLASPGGSPAAAANFAIIVNGAPFLISDTDADSTILDTVAAARYYAAIDGILAEGFFYRGAQGEDMVAIAETIREFGGRGIALFSADTNVPAGMEATIRANADLAGVIPTTVQTSLYDANNPRFTSTMGDNSPGSDLLNGGSGADILVAGGGSDMADGGTGTDTLTANFQTSATPVTSTTGPTPNTNFGGFDGSFQDGSGRQVAYTSIERFEIVGSGGGDILTTASGDDFLSGGGGNDILNGAGGNDVMRGGAGNDLFYAAQGSDLVFEFAGDGNDRIATSASYALLAGSEIEVLEAITLGSTDALNLSGNEFANLIVGNDGANILAGGAGNDVLVGLGGDDVLIGGTGADAMYGGAGSDTYHVDNAGDSVADSSGQGYDRVAASLSFALAADSEIERLEALNLAETAAMNLSGNVFNNIIVGNNGANILTGGGGNDVLIGAGGNDVLLGGSSASALLGGTGDDTYYVSDTSDAVTEMAGQGNDRIAASVSYALAAASEVERIEAVNTTATTAINLTGSASGNAIVGNAGANVLNGGGGNDALAGLGGADTFAFTTALGAGNVDQIVDFLHNVDKIALDYAVFSALAPGALAAGAFVMGTAAADNSDRIIYNGATGQLFYDADGNGAGAMVQFASLIGAPALTASDFIVT